MNKKIIGIVISVLLLGGLVWLAAPRGNGQIILAAAADYDFGAISMARGNVSHTFSVKNESGKAMVIGKTYTSCMCTTALLTAGGTTFGPYGMPGHGLLRSVGATLLPGEEMAVEVVFDPAAHGPAGIGAVQRTITIENDGGEPFVLGFSAEVTP